MLNLSNDPVPLPGDNFIRKPQRSIAGRCEPSVPFPALLSFVKRSIEFDDQLSEVAAEIRHEPAHRNLTAEV
jgi:hypothetical protein